MRSVLIAFVLAVSAAVPAVAAEEGAPICAVQRPVTARLVADAQDLKGVSGRSDMLVANLSYMREPEAEAEAASGTVIFLKRTAGWTAIVPSNWENEVGLYATADGKKIIVVAQRQIEGPGQSFTIVRTENDFATTSCTEVNFPDTLNQPTWNNEFLEPKDLDITARGRGMLVAEARIERSGERERVLRYAYRTRDGGVTWSAPREVGPNARPPAGIYAPMERREAADLVAGLQSYAREK